jgi:hypothetical protein
MAVEVVAQEITRLEEMVGLAAVAVVTVLLLGVQVIYQILSPLKAITAATE